MKTLILKKSELDKLSPELQKEINSIISSREDSISSLKTRISALKFKGIDHRTDNNIIGVTDTRDGKHIPAVEGGRGAHWEQVPLENIYFNRWKKTDGEEWGNCAGRKYTVKLGKKYIRVEIDGYKTNSSSSNWVEYISETKLSEILDLLEEAEQTGEKVDSDKLYMIASDRLYSAVTPDYY